MFYVTLSVYFYNINVIRIYLIWSTFLYTNLIALTLRFREELKHAMQKVIELNFINFVMKQSYGGQMFFEEKERVTSFSFNELVDRVVHKLIQAK
jgi:hypothetical protein